MEVKGKNMSYEEVCALFDSGLPTEPGDEVILTKSEINRGRRNKREAQKKAAGFHNAPIYRAYHATMRLLIEIVQQLPRKTVKLSDIMLQYYAEAMRWGAAAYNHNEPILKQNALEESISLMTVVKITVNCMPNLIGERKLKQLIASIDAVMRQLVAWRGSLTKSEGLDDEA